MIRLAFLFGYRDTKNDFHPRNLQQALGLPRLNRLKKMAAIAVYHQAPMKRLLERSAINILKDIIEKIPATQEPLVLYEYDAPENIPREKAESLGCCSDVLPISRREIFILGGVAFCRYSFGDDSPTLMVSTDGAWNRFASVCELYILKNLIDAKGVKGVSRGDVLGALMKRF